MRSSALILVVSGLIGLSACNQTPAQVQAVTTAALDASTCVITMAPGVVQTATASGPSDTSKAITSAQVAFTAGSQSANCKQIATDVAAAIAAGHVSAPVTTAPAATP